MPRIFVENMGVFGLSIDDAPVTIRHQKSQAIVSYLASRRPSVETRLRLCSLLWSESQDAQGSLRQEVRKLRGWAPALLSNHPSDRNTVSLLGDPVILRSQQIIDRLTAGEIDAALLDTAFPHEHLFAYLDGADSEFDQWIKVQRTNFDETCSGLLYGYLEQWRDRPALREKAARALLNFDPTHVGAIVAQLECLAGRGSRASVRKAYNDYRSHLKTEHQLDPEQRVVDAFRLALRSATDQAGDAEASRPSLPARPPALTVDPRAQRPLIIAHPLAGPKDSTPRAAQVIHVGLMEALSRFRDWSIRSSHPRDVPDIGGNWFELRFDVIGDSTDPALCTQLFQMPQGELIHVEELDCQTGQPRRAHEETIKRLAAALNIEISARRIENALRMPNESRTLYDMWLLAQQDMMTWRAADEVRAEQGFRAILERWPDHAPSLISLANILNTRHHVFPGIMRSQRFSGEALEMARRAARFAPTDHRVQLALGWCHLMTDRFEQSRHYFGQALQLNDTDPLTLISSSMGLCFAGDHAEASKRAAFALEIAAGGEPVHWAYHACIRFFCGDLEGADHAASMAAGSAHYVGAIHAAVAACRGDSDRADRLRETFMEDIAQNWFAQHRPSMKAVRNWLEASFPISLPADRDRLKAGLDAAGFK